MKDVSFTVQPGEFLTLLGPSGCGESTLIHTIAGFQPPETGEILLRAEPVCRPGPDRIMVLQEFDQLFPWRTVLGNVVFALKLKGLPQREREARARQFLTMVGLNGFENACPHQLSGGMKQRAAIAHCRVLSTKPIQYTGPLPLVSKAHAPPWRPPGNAFAPEPLCASVIRGIIRVHEAKDL